MGFCITKYTKEFKIKLVMEYLSGKSGGQKTVAKKYNVPYSTMISWINKYNSGSFDNLSKKLKTIIILVNLSYL